MVVRFAHEESHPTREHYDYDYDYEYLYGPILCILPAGTGT